MSTVENRLVATTNATTTLGCGTLRDCHEDAIALISDPKRASSLSTDSGHPHSVISFSSADLLSMDVRERSLLLTNLSEDIHQAIVLSKRVRLGLDDSQTEDSVVDDHKANDCSTTGSPQGTNLKQNQVSTALYSLSKDIQQFIDLKDIKQ